MGGGADYSFLGALANSTHNLLHLNMTENQTPSANSGQGDGQNVPKRRRHIASDGMMPRRTAPIAPRPNTPNQTPIVEPVAVPPAAPPPVTHQVAPPQTAQPVAGGRFGERDIQPTQPAQPAQPIPPTRPIHSAHPARSAQPARPTHTTQPTQPAHSAQPARQTQPKQPARGAAPQPLASVRLPIDATFERTRLLLLVAVMVPLCIWASYPAWASMLYEWSHTDDYSHGFLVIPLTILFLYMRLDTYPGTHHRLDWVGLFPIFLYGVLRIFAGIRYMDPLDMVAIWFWILGVVWFFYGWRVLVWALPSLCFLIFMFQLPWRVDVLMKNQLQYFAAHFAAVLLQIAGEAAVPIKNTIRLSSTELGVEAACSGLRFLISVFAIAVASVLMLRRPWWQNILILAIAAPLALFVNAARIAITGILLERHYEMVARWTATGQSVGAVADAFAGKIAIALALGLFALFVWYLGKIFKKVQI